MNVHSQHMHSHLKGILQTREVTGNCLRIAPTQCQEKLTCGTGINNPCSRQLVLKVQHCFAHFSRAGIFGFVAFIKHNLEGNVS